MIISGQAVEFKLNDLVTSKWKSTSRTSTRIARRRAPRISDAQWDGRRTWFDIG